MGPEPHQAATHRWYARAVSAGVARLSGALSTQPFAQPKEGTTTGELVYMSNAQPDVVVVGAGVIGLTAGICLPTGSGQRCRW